MSVVVSWSCVNIGLAFDSMFKTADLNISEMSSDKMRETDDSHTEQHQLLRTGSYIEFKLVFHFV